MAILTLTITVPDNKVSGLQDAINWEMNNDPLNPDWTLAECRTALEIKVRNELKDLYVRHQKFLASEAAANNTIDIT